MEVIEGEEEVVTDAGGGAPSGFALLYRERLR